MHNEKHKYTLRDFLNYNVGIAEDQDAAEDNHTCVMVTNDPQHGDDMLDMILLEMLLDKKITEDECRSAIIPTRLFHGSSEGGRRDGFIG